MPELDGTTILAIASFAALVVAWLAAPTDTVVTVETRDAVPAAA
jgi:hypothetical protein